MVLKLKVFQVYTNPAVHPFLAARQTPVTYVAQQFSMAVTLQSCLIGKKLQFILAFPTAILVSNDDCST